ncbi:MAG: ferredoxin [Opitutales bacterium]
MAVKENKISENVRGKFYVDNQCISCGLCREIAPEIFGSVSDTDASFVKKQPSTENEVELCMEALESCPVDAIGQDGDQ